MKSVEVGFSEGSQIEQGPTGAGLRKDLECLLGVLLENGDCRYQKGKTSLL